ncbi:MAG: potassium channel family protein [Clostridioides sp.]|jgi:hypothetical protein|nr:potassium channel family protein [Clostridioides sp.]
MKCGWKSSLDSKKNCDNDVKFDVDVLDATYCICHKSGKSEEENELMMEFIRNEKLCDFTGFVFEEDFKAGEIIDYDYDLLNFNEVVFRKDADFSNVEIKKVIKFENTKFCGRVSFRHSMIYGNCIFINTEFNKEYIFDHIFKGVHFKGQDLVIKNIKNFPRLDAILFSNYSKIILEKTSYDKGEYMNGKINYRIARNQASKIGDYERTGNYYYNERYYGSKLMKRSDYGKLSEYLGEKFFDDIAKYVTGYGQKPWNIIILILLIISVFAFLYLFAGIATVQNRDLSIGINEVFQYSFKDLLSRYLNLWYLSMMTFSTLGYDEIYEISSFGKVVSCVEVFLGMSTGAIWTSVILKRLLHK